jgi:hypothetical protein
MSNVTTDFFLNHNCLIKPLPCEVQKEDHHKICAYTDTYSYVEKSPAKHTLLQVFFFKLRTKLNILFYYCAKSYQLSITYPYIFVFTPPVIKNVICVCRQISFLIISFENYMNSSVSITTVQLTVPISFHNLVHFIKC